MLRANSEVSTNAAITRSAKQRAEDRQHPDDQRDGGRDHAAEDQQQQHRQDRERDQLGVGQVLAGLVVDLVEARREPAVADVEQVGRHPLAHRLVGEPALVLDVGGRQLRGQHQRPRRPRRPGRRLVTLPTYAAPRSSSASRSTSACDRRVVGVERAAVGRPDQHDQAGLGGVPERVGEHLAGPLALRRRVGEAGRLEVVLDVVTEERRPTAANRKAATRILRGWCQVRSAIRSSIAGTLAE